MANLKHDMGKNASRSFDLGVTNKKYRNSISRKELDFERDSDDIWR
jgi:hypothetical protein